MLSNYDFAGSGWQISQAIRKHTSHNSIIIKRFSHERNYHTEYLISSGNNGKFQNFINKADIVHFKGDDPPPKRHWFGLRIPNKTKIVITVSGSKFRRLPNGTSSIALRSYPIRAYVEHSDFRTAISPDLNYPEFKGVFTPCLIDSESVEPCWKINSPPVIGYYPSSYNRKGCNSHIIPALRELKDKGYKFEELPIRDVKQIESIELKKQMTVYIDQVVEEGYYGMSALEAMQFGVPVVAYLSEKSMEMSRSEELRNAPILNPGYSVDGLVNLLKDILDGKIDLNEVSKKTKQYCTDFHGYQKGARMWGEIYERVLSGS